MATKYERLASEHERVTGEQARKEREVLRRKIRIDTERRFKTAWSTIPAEVQQKMMEEWLANPDAETGFDRDLLNRVVESNDDTRLRRFVADATRLTPAVAPTLTLIDYELAARESGVPGASEVEIPDFIKNEARSALLRQKADLLSRAGKGIPAEGRRSQQSPIIQQTGKSSVTISEGDVFKPFSAAERMELEQKLERLKKQRELAILNTQVAQMEEAQDKKHAASQKKIESTINRLAAEAENLRAAAGKLTSEALRRRRLAEAAAVEQRIKTIEDSARKEEQQDALALKTIELRERLKAEIAASGVEATGSPEQLNLKIKLAQIQLDRGGTGGKITKTTGERGPSKGAPETIRAERGVRQQEYINDAIRDYVYGNSARVAPRIEAGPGGVKRMVLAPQPSLPKKRLIKFLEAHSWEEILNDPKLRQSPEAMEINKVRGQASREYAMFEGQASERGGRVSRAASFAAQYERDVVNKAMALARLRIGPDEWSDMSDEEKLAAAEPLMPGFESVHRGERVLYTRRLAEPKVSRIERGGYTPAQEKLVETEEVWGTPADVATLTQMFGARPSRSIYIGTGVQGAGSKSIKRDNPTFVLPNGKLKPNPAYVAAKAKGVPEEELKGIPKTLLALAIDRWERDRAYLTQTPSKVIYDENGMPRLVKQEGAKLIVQDEKGGYREANAAEEKILKRSMYDFTAKDRFYRRAAAIDPSNRIANEARRRIRDELDALGMPRGTKEEKAAYSAKVESLVPMMMGSILADRIPANPQEAEMAAFLTRALKTQEIVIPAGVSTEVEKRATRASRAVPARFETKLVEEPFRLQAIENVDARFRAIAVKTAGPEIRPSDFPKPQGVSQAKHDEAVRKRIARRDRVFADVMAELRKGEDEAVRTEFNRLIRGERLARSGVRVIKKPTEKLDGLGLLDFQNDMTGSLLMIGIGGGIAYLMYRYFKDGK